MSTDYIAKNDLDRLFKELLVVLSNEEPENPLACSVKMLDNLITQRAKGHSISNYKEFFENYFRDQKVKLDDETSTTDLFSSFSWDNNGKSREQVLEEAPSQEEEEWDENAKDKAVKTISGGPVKYPIGFNAGRRFSISAEPYTPKEGNQFHRVVIAKDDDTRERIKTAVEHNLLFRNLDNEQTAQILDAMFEKKVPKNVEIIRQGDEGDYFYVIDSGKFEVVKDGNKVVELGPGETFGELALMYGSPRLATVKAIENSIVWAVDRATFRGIVIDLSFKKRKMYENFLRSVPLLSTLHDHEIYRICDALQPVHFNPNDTIVRQGDVGHEFFIIEEGEASVTIHQETFESEDVQVANIKKGDYFGELALLRDAPRAATVKAVTPVKCVTLTKADFIRLLGPVMPILQRNQDHYRKYEEYMAEA